MKFIADLHIHSHYSMATSSKLTPEYLEYWGRLKGINVIGTGDCIHPGWLSELAEKLEPTENGFFVLKDSYRLEESKRLKHENIPDRVYFILTGEISSIYKRDDKVRKVHNLTVFPDMESLIKVQRRLDEIGNIRSDGRPILGLDSRIILEMVLESSEKSFLIPAHIWTPWFSVLGSKSGFDTLDECYGDLTKHIFAVETGLSSDPPMNWTCSFLDNFRLVSNSDAHSPEKLGREANLFDTELTYDGIYNSLKNDKGFTGTVEFFPQEGKYHYDGHKKCSIMLNPLETAKHEGICPVCGKEVTKGVMYRVAELGDRNSDPFLDTKEYHYITQLPDVIAEIKKQRSSSSKSITSEYMNIINQLGSEFHIYLNSHIDEISSAGGELLGEAVRRLRNGEINISEGFDGEFGTVKVFHDGEIDSFRYSPLFRDSSVHEPVLQPKHSMEFDIKEFKELVAIENQNRLNQNKSHTQTESNRELTAEQTDAVTHIGSSCLIIAGPGSGKTRVLAERVKYLINERFALPAEIAALTFSKKAADEIAERISRDMELQDITISTIHSFGLSILRNNYEDFGLKADFLILSDDERSDIVRSLNIKDKKNISKYLKEISKYKQGIVHDLATVIAGSDPQSPSGIIHDLDTIAGYSPQSPTGIVHDLNNEILSEYQNKLKEINSIDIDDLVFLTSELLTKNESFRKKSIGHLRHLLIDEFQDINAAQYKFIKAITLNSDCVLTAIGDPDQSIYGFRGSDNKYINNLKSAYPNLKTVALTKSFRCPDTILKAADDVMDRENYLMGVETMHAVETRHALSLRSPTTITIHESENEHSEADYIAKEIVKIIGGVRSLSIESGISDGENKNYGFSDFAVLCRASFMFDPIIKAFDSQGIPYQMIDNEPFYMKEPYKSPFKAIRECYLPLKRGDKNHSNHLFSMVKDTQVFNMIKDGESLTTVAQYLLKNQSEGYDEDKVLRFTQSIKDYDEFIRIYNLRSGVDDYKPEFEAVPIITIHSAKGLEFKNVFIPGCEESIIPFTLFGKNDKTDDPLQDNDLQKNDLDEERRIFYVAITRAKEKLYLSHAEKRFYRGRALTLKKSRFLEKISKELIKLEKREQKLKKKDDNQLTMF